MGVIACEFGLVSCVSIFSWYLFFKSVSFRSSSVSALDPRFLISLIRLSMLASDCSWLVFWDSFHCS